MKSTRIRVALIYGSGREGRFCDVVAAWAAEQIWNDGLFLLDIIDPAALTFPARRVLEDGAEIAALRRRLAEADAYVIVTPEYNHGYPAALKSLIDSADVEWQAKPVAFVSYGGVSGGLHAVEQLRAVFANLHAVTIRDTVSFARVRRQFDAAGDLLQSKRTGEAMGLMLRELRWWAVALRDARKRTPYAQTISSGQRNHSGPVNIRPSHRSKSLDRARAVRLITEDDRAADRQAESAHR